MEDGEMKKNNANMIGSDLPPKWERMREHAL